MRIKHLSLSNFRNYGRLELPLRDGPTLLVGDNAQGKTNLLEAIYYLATTRSHHASQDSQLVTWDVAQSKDPLSASRLVAQVETAEAQRLVEMRLILERRENGSSSFRREALVNRRKVRLMDLLGHLQVVLFLPEDVSLVSGPPAERRRYLDITLCQVDPVYCRTLSRYNKVLEQRNALLRQLSEGEGSREVLEILTDKLVEQGSQILARRAAFFSDIAPDVRRIHFEELTDGRESLSLNYLPRLRLKKNGTDEADLLDDSKWMIEERSEMAAIAGRFETSLQESIPYDIARGATSIGPHRDDWRFWVNGRSLGDYGSRGQQRSAVLALKMAQIDWMAALTGETPVLLLDEVLAELDELRRRQLLRYVQKAEQAILTATDPAMFSNEFLQAATCLSVRQGTIRPLSEAPA
ncbi:MAG: DNA replication/repair protein RecF [Candidatus Promineifilaceae bacterium]